MKTVFYLAVFLVVSPLAFGQETLHPRPWKMTVKVIDDNGEPVAGSHVEVIYSTSIPADGSAATNRVQGVTDTNGVSVAAHTDRSLALLIHVEKPGYYTSSVHYQLSYNPAPVINSTEQTLILRKIGAPIPMYAKSVNLGLPVFDKPVGFDLMAGDWVTPFGQGSVTDVVFKAHREIRAENDSDYRLVVSFSQHGDGIQEFRTSVSNPGGGSELRLPGEAPADGYRAEWVQTKLRRPGRPLQSNWNADRTFFFRVRTVLDASGHVKSALYGKIYGDFMRFCYYLNPEPNSRIVEFDPKRNLMPGIAAPDEKVRAP